MSDEKEKAIFSENLNRLLKDRKKSQKEVADAIGVSPQTFNTWCQGIALPRMGKVQKLADYFIIEKSDLIDPPKTEDQQSVTLTPMERRLLDYYRLLTNDKQTALLQFLDIEEDQK